MNQRIFIFTVVFFMLIGFSLRVRMILFGLPSKNWALSTYNPDEQNNYHTLEKWEPKKLRFPPGQVLHWGNLHLFTIVAAIGISKVIGYVKFGNREFYIKNLAEVDKLYIAGRVISVVVRVASIFMIILIMKKFFVFPSYIFSGIILTFLPVHMVNSIYVRPDVMMMFFCCLILFISFNILYSENETNYILAGIACRLGIATKYSCGSYIFLPILAHIIKNQNLKSVFQLKILKFIFMTIISFIIGCPYVFLEPKSFYAAMKHVTSLARGIFIDEFGFIPAWVRYLVWFFPYGCGIFLTIFFIFGLLVCLLTSEFDKKIKIFLITGFFIVFFFDYKT